MSKGDDTRRAIVGEAMRLASTVGLEGLSIGGLAEQVGLSKSGLFAHFRSKEKLQIEVIDAAAAAFVDRVVAPALKEPRGEPRVRALIERWLEWASRALPGGCLFVTAAVEMDDRSGPVRDTVVKHQRDWLATLARAARIAVEEGHFRPDLDAEGFAFEAHAMMLGAHHAVRLLQDPGALGRARAAFASLLTRSRA